MSLKECKRCLFTEDIAKLTEDSCEYCQMHDVLASQSNYEDLMPTVAKIKKAGKGKQYDVLVGISGGLDSSTLLYLAVKFWGLRPLVIHFDNHYNAPEAKHNMEQLVKRLNVNAITYNVDKNEYDTLNEAFLWAGVPDADIPNDIAMTKLMYDTADKYGIKYILNGHDFRTEGSTPRDWTYMDAKYVNSVYKWHTGGYNLENYPLFTFWDQIKYGFKGIKQVRPFHFGLNRNVYENEMKQFIDWKDYGGKHCENVYTEYVGSALLPNKFNIDKRIVYLSARIRSGEITKDDAHKILGEIKPFNYAKLGDIMESVIAAEQDAKKQPRTNFDRYNFKKYRFFIWILYKLKVVPYTFYKKYCF